MLALNINRKMFMMILDEESFTDIDTELCPDGLDAGVYDVYVYDVYVYDVYDDSRRGILH